MVYRLSWVAGIAGIAFALARAERLLRASPSGLPWEAILVAAALIGGAITWAGVSYRVRGSLLVATNLVAVLFAVVRIAVPGTTWFVFPTLDSFTALGNELAFARDVIRTGVAPVLPLAGVVAILAVVFWAMGALLVWGLRSGRPYLAVITPLVVYLEFAVMDRRPGGAWTTAFTVVIGISLLAVAMDRRRQGTGVLVSAVTRRALLRSLPSIGVMTLAFTLVLSLAAANAVTDLVPRSGYLDWRAQSTLSGEYYGSVAYNPFVGIRQQLVSQTNVPVFVATVSGDLPADRISWRMVTLDTFDGTQWHIGGRPRIVRSDEVDRFEDREFAFAGPVADVVADVTVLALQMDWLPAPYAPTAMTSPNDAVDQGFRVRTDDGSLRFDALTYRGMQYTVRSAVPQPDLDILGRLASGVPSIVFRNAVADEAFTYRDDTVAPIPQRTLPDPDRYLDLPDTIGPRVVSLARATTANLQTDFERAIALETFFRTPGTFRYSTAVLPGHGASDLADWLLDPESANYRTGYCEQFATAMAVMARMVGIPSRVVLGFTPGSVIEDGRVVVRDRNAHAWVELWMPSQGWVAFDPTPRGDGVNPPAAADIPFDIAPYLDIPDAARPAPTGGGTGPVLFRDDEEVAPTTIPQSGGGSTVISVPRLPAWSLPAALSVLAGFGLIPGLKWLRRRRRLRRLSTGDIAAAWQELVDRLTDLGDPPSPTTTPLEIARATDPVMTPLAGVYAEAIYGPSGQVTARSLAIATRAFEDTEGRLVGRYSTARRAWSRYRLTSLVPIRRPRRRRR